MANSLKDVAKSYLKNPIRVFTGLSIVKELNRYKGEIASYAIEHPIKTAAFGLAMVAGVAVLGTAVAASGALALAGPGGIALAATVGLTAVAAGSIAFQVASNKLISNANDAYITRQTKLDAKLNEFSLADPVVPNPAPVKEQSQPQTIHMFKTGPATNVKRRTKSLNQKLDKVPHQELKQDTIKLPRSKSVEKMIKYYKKGTKLTVNDSKTGPTLGRTHTVALVNKR